jgi:hypothetical protein
LDVKDDWPNEEFGTRTGPIRRAVFDALRAGKTARSPNRIRDQTTESLRTRRVGDDLLPAQRPPPGNKHRVIHLGCRDASDHLLQSQSVQASALVPIGDATTQFNGLAKRGMEVGFRPCLFAFAHHFPIGQTLVDDKPFQRRQPMLVVVRAIIWLTTIVGSLQLIGQRSGPFLPRKMAVLGEFARAGYSPLPACPRPARRRSRVL